MQIGYFVTRIGTKISMMANYLYARKCANINSRKFHAQ